MTIDKVDKWLRDKETHVRNKADNKMYRYGVDLCTSDLPYLNAIKRLIAKQKALEIKILSGNAYCPRCDKPLDIFALPHYCPNCGQKITWNGKE